MFLASIDGLYVLDIGIIGLDGTLTSMAIIYSVMVGLAIGDSVKWGFGHPFIFLIPLE